ncbi:hypothetical protein D777_00112 [Marinobacter nitratireducens]|uniref:Uncharacterized protein n=1 Tax=Marinobacter nitratireducens TaxID=1137280 RepID=A0A072N5Z9_9GAMM|nr:hypothetical protein D777_00112 [Marinobacter nitratireducens]
MAIVTDIAIGTGISAVTTGTAMIVTDIGMSIGPRWVLTIIYPRSCASSEF